MECRPTKGLPEFAINDVNDAIVEGTRRPLQRQKRSHLRWPYVFKPQPIGIFVRQDSESPVLKTSKVTRLLQVWMLPNRALTWKPCWPQRLTWDDVKTSPVPDLSPRRRQSFISALDAHLLALAD